jgi:OTU domain-containing protein 5
MPPQKEIFSNGPETEIQTMDTPLSISNDENINQHTEHNVMLPSVGDIVDVLDSVDRWAEAEVVKVDRQLRYIFVSYLNWDSQFDVWIQDIRNRVAPLNTYTYNNQGNFKIGQRIDAYDSTRKWLEAYVIDINQTQVMVHYKSFNAKFDEWHDKDGKHLRAFINKKPLTRKKREGVKRWRVPDLPDNSRNENINNRHNMNNQNSSSIAESKSSSQSNAITHTRQISEFSDRFNHYIMSLQQQHLAIYSVEGDGNCLFRSIAHQIYGNQEYHHIVRDKCMDYMEANSQFFSQFVEGGMEYFHFYLRAKRMSACWGDDPEIQAMCELYNRPADIWAYDCNNGASKLRTFHEAISNYSNNNSSINISPVIRLSYYGGGHYDSVVDNQQNNRNILHSEPGVLENEVIANLIESRRNSSVVEAKQESDRAATDRAALEIAIQNSRYDNLCRADEDLESCLLVSLKSKSNDYKDSKHIDSNNEYKSINNDINATQTSILQNSTEQSEREFIETATISSLNSESKLTEEELLDQARLESLKDYKISNYGDDSDIDMALKLSELSEEQALELAMNQSRSETINNYSDNKSNYSSDKNISKDNDLSEDATFQAALTASISDSSLPIKNNLMSIYRTTYDDEDEELRRAIAESLKR